MAGLPFVMYAYVAGKDDTLVTNARGGVDKDDILPANWAILAGSPGWQMISNRLPEDRLHIRCIVLFVQGTPRAGTKAGLYTHHDDRSVARAVIV